MMPDAPVCARFREHSGKGRRSGFTMIELMIVIAIMGIVMAIGVPSFVKIWHQDALRKSVASVVEVCSHARARAILQGVATEVIFHAKEGTFEVANVPSNSNSESGNAVPVASNPASSSGLSGQFPEDVAVAKLSINGVSSMDAELAKVRFYPNGTSDDLRLIIMRPDTREARGIFLEVTTGLADVETDPNKLADEIR